MNPQLLIIPTAARIAEESEAVPPQARQIQWAPMPFSEQKSKGEWDAILEKSWIKLRPHASVPIAEETRKTQEHFFPLTLTSYEYVAKPIAEETAVSDEVTPSAGKTIGKIKALTISKQISKPTTTRQRKKSAERPPITHIERAKTSNARCAESGEIIAEGSLRFASEGQVFAKKFRKPDCVKLLPGELCAIVGWNSLSDDPDEVDDIITHIIDTQQSRYGAGFMESPAHMPRKTRLAFEDAD